MISMEEQLNSLGVKSIKPNGRATKGTRSGPEFEITLDKLRNKSFPPIKWVVPLFLPEGLTVFAGKPKIGKSWLMLGVALGVALGTKALGQRVEKGDVLYCGLEDGERRMQFRCTKILGEDRKSWPKNFTFRYGLDALEDGGLEFIDTWLVEHPKARLIVVDTLGKIKGNKAKHEEQYQYDYRMVGGLQELATKHRVALVVVHHVRKAVADDVLDTVSGSTGIAGAADSVMVLGRERGGVRFRIRGRDSEEQDKLAEFNADKAIWEIKGDYEEATAGSTLQGLRARVYNLLSGSESPLKPVTVATMLNESYEAVKRALLRMTKADPPLAFKSASVFGAYEAAAERPQKF